MLLCCMLIFYSINSIAQDKVKANISADLVSGYICRGQDYGGVSVQPSLTVSYEGLSLNAWGSTGFNRADNREVDLILKYKISNIEVYVTDYWIMGEDNKYFDFSPNSTAHVLEGSIRYDFGFFAMTWSTMFAGADGVNKNGKRAYSSYLNLMVPFSFGGLNWSAEIGATPWATSFYENANCFAVCDISLRTLKKIEITNSFNILSFAKLTFNPTANKAYFTFGFTF